MKYVIGILVVLVLAKLFLSLWMKKRKKQKERPFIPQEPSLSPTEHSLLVQNDADEVLGLKQKPKIQRSEEKVQNLPEVIAFYLMADSDQAFEGYELLQALLAAGLRHGKMNIFHRHEDKNGRGSVLFSLASAQEPGTFDLPKMGAFSSQGLVLFLSPRKVNDPEAAFNALVETLYLLQEELGGVILDEQRQALNEMTIKQIQLSLKGDVEPSLSQVRA